MLMPKGNIVAIYEHLFKEGVLVAEKDVFLPKHPELQNIPNLHVIKALQSLKSRGYVEQNFAWRHYYWRLTNEGIQYLRDYLHLPSEIVPATLKKPTRTEGARVRPSGGRPDGPKAEGSRETYRRNPGTSDKTGEAGAGSAPMHFRGGFGRGRQPPSQ
ncbi:UNVERIFIED_CONTAM: hypothetical protein RMT77_003912 [Armadillidium vulgare]|uniref:40S ribosomal protein S10 n=1 Tax=Armadillidium nasatum TaxID=96803 RepID=A0A5N5SMW9_9CRUS|nr:40S ribosomal protein S10 [Armadillidium nasatum]RXG60154.1 40S ribosomal protein S10 [Armadillidium vulgare]